MELNLNKLSVSKSSEPKHVQLLIIGGGPAGFAAALYAGRAELNTVILTGMVLGGQVSLTHSIENYPGFPEGISGTDLTELFQKQAERFGAEVVFDEVQGVDFSERPFKIITGNQTEYLADSVILSTGASHRELNIPGEKEFTGKGVSYCGTCDGFFFKGKNIIVVGGGDSALEEGIFLTRFADSVTIIHRREELRGGAILEKRAKENPKIKFIWNTVVKEIKGNGAVSSVLLENIKTGKVKDFETEGVFIFIGHTPNSSIFKDQLEMDPAGYVMVSPTMETSVEGIFAAGELADPHFRQVITSAGMGAAAAIQAVRFLEESA